MAFVHRSLSHLCSVVTSAALPTGMGNTLGNKGAVALFLKIGNTKMLIVNAHLSAHQKAEKQRNAEFQKINVQIPTLLEKKDSSIGAAEVITTDFNSTSPDNAVPPNTESGAALSPTTATEGTDTNNNNDSDDEAEPNNDDTIVVTRTQSSSVDVRTKSTSKQLHQCADVVVFMGDLNYRINGNRSIVSKLLNSNMHEVLLSNDQLKMNIQKGLVFEKFVGKLHVYVVVVILQSSDLRPVFLLQRLLSTSNQRTSLISGPTHMIVDPKREFHLGQTEFCTSNPQMLLVWPIIVMNRL